MSKRHHPYDNQKRSQTRGRAYQANQQSSSLPPSPTSNHPATGSEGTVRESFVEIVREKHPYFKPRTDFDVFALASGDYTGTPSGIYTWLDGELALYLALIGDMEAVMEETRRFLDRRGSITGRKPKPSAPNVFVRSIPNSPYSIRLFPGSLAHQEYCMDFVVTSTGQPVNSPFEFELWALPSSHTPWLGGLPMRVHSLERVYRYADADILAGAEKFLLKDGQTCLLKRPGHRNLRFTVPVRAAALRRADLDDDQLHFPSMI
ncbi:hypothetical protein LXA43DRAFT_892707 [Ganoderma leucocontextum]|nr:hypothetical protein LXA43DRAFT_892707 [Ganoderma leucocontextum]